MTNLLYIYLGLRYFIPNFIREEVPFNCNFSYNVSENVKIACRRRFISYTLGFSLYAFSLLIPLYFLISNVTKRISDSLQRNLFVL